MIFFKRAKIERFAPFNDVDAFVELAEFEEAPTILDDDDDDEDAEFDDCVPTMPPFVPFGIVLSEMTVSRSLLPPTVWSDEPFNKSEVEVVLVAVEVSPTLLLLPIPIDAPGKVDPVFPCMSGLFRKDENTSELGEDGVARRYEADGVDNKCEVEEEV